MHSKSIIYLMIVVYFFLGCSYKKKDKEEILNAFEKHSFCKVLDYYAKKKDTLGYKSAIFLIHNLVGKKTIDISAHSIKLDEHYVTDDYLIKNIDLACQISRKDLSSGKVSFNNFCEYILPYRIGNESLIDWRKSCFIRYKKYISSNHTLVCDSINNKLKLGFTFSHDYPNAIYRNWSDLMDHRGGDCWAMAHTVVYPLRALGVPVAVDFTPFWANVNGGSHSWNALILSDSSSSPFMGCETSPPKYDPFLIYRQKRLPAKVYRHVFSRKNDLDSALLKDNLVPKYLTKRSLLDVTDLYSKTITVTVDCVNVAKLPEISCLAIFTNGDWQPVSWSKENNKKYVFDKMPQNLLYLHAYDKNSELFFNQYPFFYNLGRCIVLKPNLLKKSILNLKNKESKPLAELKVFGNSKSESDFYAKMDFIQSNTIYSQPIKKKKYQLYFWDNKWILASESLSDKNRILHFKDVPTNALYRLCSDENLDDERCFTYINNKLVWW